MLLNSFVPSSTLSAEQRAVFHKEFHAKQLSHVELLDCRSEEWPLISDTLSKLPLLESLVVDRGFLDETTYHRLRQSPELVLRMAGTGLAYCRRDR